MILPPVTRPWRETIGRLHRPLVAKGSKGFQSYRACLRWEFGFSCAFCLCHESDLAPYGVEGSALTHVEHFIPQSLNATQRNDYYNCFYICRFCNVSKGATYSDDAEGRSLLNPCTHAWLEFFTVSRDEILPRDEDGDAAYTSDVYELNDPRKKRMRRLRRLTIGQCTGFLRRSRTIEHALLDNVQSGGGIEYVDVAREIVRQRRRAYMDLLKFRAVPHDCDTSCACGHHLHHQLPGSLLEQNLDLEDFQRSPKQKTRRRKG